MDESSSYPMPKSLRHTGPEILDHHVRVGNQFLSRRLASVGFQVQGHRPLAAVPGGERRRGSRRVAARSLHLDDVRALIGEQHSQHGPGDVLPELYDVDIAQCAGGTVGGHQLFSSVARSPFRVGGGSLNSSPLASAC